LEYCPSQAVIDWAAERLTWYAATAKDRTALLVMHSFINTKGGLHDTKNGNKEKCWEFGNASLNAGAPSDIYQQLVVPYNVRIVLAGHDNGGGWKGGTYARYVVPSSVSGAPADRDVHVFLSNYQYIGSADPADKIANGKVGAGLGYFRVMRFDPLLDRIRVSVWSEWSHDYNDGKWNPTYAAADTEQKNPLNFAGDPASKFNEDKVCTTPGTSTAYPGQCDPSGWKVVDGICADLATELPKYPLTPAGAPHQSFVVKCNVFSVPFKMTGDGKAP